MVTLCTPSRVERVQRGAMYRNMYLQGDPDGKPQTYNRVFPFLDNLGSYLYSPAELRFRIERYGAENLIDRAKFRAAASELHRQVRNASVDTAVEAALTWSLVKGKTFIKMGWSEDGFEPRLVQPELMGVLEEDKSTLDEQEAFVHTVYVTPTRFQQLVENSPDRADLLTKIGKYLNAGTQEARPDHSMLRQVVVGGMNPYQTAGGASPSSARGNVQWMTGPQPTHSPRLLARLIAIDELWVRDSDRGDWTTIQVVGDDCLLTGKSRNRNLFADPFDPDNTKRRLQSNDNNPLAGHHPFVEFCSSPLDGYFFGLSEIHHIALLQESLNHRIDGLNWMLRMQEKPPRFFSAVQGITQSTLSRLNKPGGYLSDPSPNAKVQDMAPTIPADIWESLHEIERMYDEVGGFAPVTKGRGESGVRAQGHAETLLRTATPRFKDRALLVERQVEELGGLCLDVLKAKWSKPLTAWAPGNIQSIETMLPPTYELETPPVDGMRAVEFLFHQLPDCKLVVDSHSSSPAFSHEARQLAFDLAKAGSVTPTELISMTHPPHEDSLITDAERREAQQAKLAAEHPELLLHPRAGGRKK